MIRRLWWMALLPLAAQAADDFALQWPLQPAQADAGAYRVTLDAGVYRAAYWRDLRDVQVLDADGKPLDGAAIELEAAEPPQLWWEKMWGSVQVADSPAEEEASEEPKASEPPRTIELTPDDEDD